MHKHVSGNLKFHFMSISFLRNRYPIALWLKGSNIADITFGWNDFRSKAKSINGSITLPIQWIERKESQDEILEYLYQGRKSFILESYEIIDGINSIYDSIAEKAIFKNLTISGFPSNDFYPLCLLKKEEIPQLYFTAPKEFISNILKGNQPIRWSTYYRANEQLEEENLTFDKTEGAETIEEVEEINFPPKYKNHVAKRLSFVSTHFDGLIFSMHDDKISSEQKVHFGKEEGITFRISDIDEWCKSIMNEVHNYLMKNSVSLHHSKKIKNFIGTISIIGKCSYKGSKAVRSKDQDFSSSKLYDNQLIRNTGTTRLIGTTLIKQTIPNDLFESIENDFFTKPLIYKPQSEWRLAIIPIWADNKGVGYINQSSFADKEFYAEKLNFELLVPT